MLTLQSGDPPPQAGSEVGCCSLCPSCGWARLNPQLCVYGGEGLEGLGMGSQIQWGGVL